MSGDGRAVRTMPVSNGHAHQTYLENRVAVLVDCDNMTPTILDYALRIVAQFGRLAIRRGYGNHTALGLRWQEALAQQAFTPHLQYQYPAGKNTADIALALDALEVMFDQRADIFCLVTSDSDFAYLCRKTARARCKRVCRQRNENPSCAAQCKRPFFRVGRRVEARVRACSTAKWSSSTARGSAT